MRKKIIAGNWKMNKGYSEGLSLASGVLDAVRHEFVEKDVTVILAPPFIHLHALGLLASGTKNVRIAAQNCAAEASGAYTGEVSAAMIKSAGAHYVVVGHSERRAYFHETPELLKKKVDLVLANDLIPIFCCGETLPERESSLHFDVVSAQLSKSLFHLSESQAAALVVAYEPVWAIGTGVTATPGQAQEMHAYIRHLFAERFGKTVAENLSILYGGSCNPANASALFSNPDVDGGLVGGASLIAGDFISIVRAV